MRKQLREFYSVQEVAKSLEISPETIRRYIRRRQLKAHRIGKGWRISHEELTRFLGEQANTDEAIPLGPPPKPKPPSPETRRKVGKPRETPQEQAQPAGEPPAETPDPAQKVTDCQEELTREEQAIWVLEHPAWREAILQVLTRQGKPWADPEGDIGRAIHAIRTGNLPGLGQVLKEVYRTTDGGEAMNNLLFAYKYILEGRFK